MMGDAMISKIRLFNPLAIISLAFAVGGFDAAAAEEDFARTVALREAILAKAANAKFADDEAFAARARDRVVLLQGGDAETHRLWNRLVDMSTDYFNRVYTALGVQLTEPPSHTSWDDTVLEEGRVLTLEPGMLFAPGRMMVHEENIVIRAEGPELLSRRAAPELPIMG